MESRGEGKKTVNGATSESRRYGTGVKEKNKHHLIFLAVYNGDRVHEDVVIRRED